MQLNRSLPKRIVNAYCPACGEAVQNGVSTVMDADTGMLFCAAAEGEPFAKTCRGQWLAQNGGLRQLKVQSSGC